MHISLYKVLTHWQNTTRLKKHPYLCMCTGTYTPQHHGNNAACYQEQPLQIHMVILGSATAGNARRVGTMC